MAADFASIPTIPRDEAFAITADFIADQHPNKISLGAGVYRDENSKPWVLPSVKAVCSSRVPYRRKVSLRANKFQARQILNDLPTLNHEYLPIQGFEAFLASARDLVLGQYDTSLTHVVSVQTISGTGANHLGAAFLGQQLKPRQVFISDPTWSNHHLIWEVAVPEVVRKTYPYYKASTRTLDFEGMISTLERDAEEGDVVILHACAHNPTGVDPTREEWKALAKLFKRKKLFPFFDSAYQGFATGDVDADAWAIRHFQEVLFHEDADAIRPEGMLIAQSFAKNFGLYGERVGALHLVLPSRTSPAGPRSQLLRLVRAEISNAPLFGCRIVQTILSNPELRAMWKQDLLLMSGRIKRMRTMLRYEIEKHPGVGSWDHLESQIGMFSYTGLTEKQVARLRDAHHIYLMRSGRASLSGVNEKNAKYIADAISDVMRQ